MKRPSVNKNVQVKIFIGYLVTPEFRSELEKSDTWKQAMILAQSEEEGFREMIHEGKPYLGYFANQVSLEELRIKEKALREMMMQHCPEINLSLLQCKIFPELFIK